MAPQKTIIPQKHRKRKADREIRFQRPGLAYPPSIALSMAAIVAAGLSHLQIQALAPEDGRREREQIGRIRLHRTPSSRGLRAIPRPAVPNTFALPWQCLLDRHRRLC
jgi:hypothetical protein